MGKYVINGGRKLDGEIKLQSAKNSVLPILAASILTDEEVVVKNCPKIKDVYAMLNILSHLGVKYQFYGDDLLVNASDINSYTIPKNLSVELRSSIFMLGALISRFKKARISFPGGCNIGARPIDIHLLGLEKLGCFITELDEELVCSVKNLVGNDVYLRFPSVGATINIMLASIFAKGKTQIHNAAKEPEIVDLMKFLNKMGAKVYGAGTSTILIEGVKKLHGCEYLPISDRIECGTYMIAAAITGGKMQIYNCNVKNILFLMHKLVNYSCKISIKSDIMYLTSLESRKSFSFTTGPYPNFSTDLQAQTMSLLAVSNGQSVVTENVFENRFNHVQQLIKMGANILVKDRSAFIQGVSALHGADVLAQDLRGGASLVLAGLNAEGKTTINDIHHIERGYCLMNEKLRSLGADIIKEE
ncbi:MAG: UDP-N-acetylglucosamine 1-carboxyvinyltransferase [Clostridiales bacterium]|nr:UDP-N-acetylglucosamine 1-carboxyvinyltransferase [Clostridiales bacterium]